MKQKRTDLIMFDLDGTLIDSSDDIAWAANRTLVHMGYDECDVRKIREAIGWGVKNLLGKIMPAEGADKIEIARQIFLDFYQEHLTVKTVPYSGVAETLEHFRGLGKKMAVVTNKPIRLTERLMKELGLYDLFFMVLGGDSLPNRKPHPEPLERVLSEAGIACGKAVLVGDSSIDCEAGRMAGVFTVGAAYGFRGRDELEAAGCDVIIKEICELKGMLI